MAPGEEQELRLEQYLRSHRSCVEIFAPDQQVRQELQLPRNCKCADILALHAPRAAVTEVTVAESKGTDISTALVQLGNAAAGALECFLGLHTLHLLICVPRLVQTSVGRSPGPGFTAGASSTAAFSSFRTHRHRAFLRHERSSNSAILGTAGYLKFRG